MHFLIFRNILFAIFTQFVILFFLFLVTCFMYSPGIAFLSLPGGIISIIFYSVFSYIFFLNNKNFSSTFFLKKFYVITLLKFLLLYLIFFYLLKLKLYGSVCFFLFLFIVQLLFSFIYFII